MKIGILSDTHNNLEITRRAIDIFKSHVVDIIIHSGDLSSPKMLSLFEGLNCKFVLGNMDLDVELLNAEAERLGFGPVEHTCEINISGKRILVLHGNDVPEFRRAVASGNYDYIIKGHTHCFENYISNRARIINPGSLYGGSDHSVVILNTDNDSIEKIAVSGDTD